jgi:hypothetical protein
MYLLGRDLLLLRRSTMWFGVEAHLVGVAVAGGAG